VAQKPSGPVTRFRFVRPSTTRSVGLLWAKSVLNAFVFFAVFLVALPWLAGSIVERCLPVPALPARVLGVVLFAGGLVLWGTCLDVFSRRGRGTPFPLDAPARLVTTGPYAYLRNPIMAGELAAIWGEAFYFRRLGLFVYAALLTAAAHLLVILVEEPELRQRFGEDYRAYCARVPRWLPRLQLGGRSLMNPRPQK